MKKILILSATIATLVGCQSQQKKPTTPALNNNAIVQAHSGHSFVWHQEGHSGPSVFNADNTASLTYKGKKSSGSWSVKDNKLCTKWALFRSGAQRCSTVYDMGDGSYDHYRDGKFNSKFIRQ